MKIEPILQVENENYNSKSKSEFQIKKQIKSNFEQLQNELNKNESEINLFLLYEITYIKTTLYKQINQKIRFYIQ